MQEKNKSQVARLREQIMKENESAVWAMNAPTFGVSRHKFITRRMERIGILHEELKKHVGEKEADTILLASMEGTDRS